MGVRKKYPCSRFILMKYFNYLLHHTTVWWFWAETHALDESWGGNAYAYGKWLMQQWDGAHVDAHDEVHIVWCTCILAYDVYAYELSVYMSWCIVRDAHDMYMMRCMHDDAHVYECMMHMLMIYGAHDAVSAWFALFTKLDSDLEDWEIRIRGESYSHKQRYLACF
jgi:hypothetical protein